jgi:hypothetical protein
MEMKCMFNIGKNISKWAKVTQVSDVAHGPLVYSVLLASHNLTVSSLLYSMLLTSHYL